jgi:glucoamylase
VYNYNILFCGDYPINTADTASGIPGVLYGRYHGDSYAGGNPWQLLTAALGNLFYRGATYILDHGVPSAEAVEMWALAFNQPASSLNGLSATKLANVFAAAGDSVMTRLRKHVEGKSFHLDEQIDKYSGMHRLFIEV